MIHQILVPVARVLTNDEWLVEQVKFEAIPAEKRPDGLLATMNEESLQELDKYLNDGYTILESFDTKSGQAIYRAYTLYKPDKPEAAAAATQAHLRLVDTITKKQTFSQSTSQYFNFWKCSFPEGGFVNIFNHPDKSRNTFEIVLMAGWQDEFESLELDSVACLHEYLPVTISNDGQWNKLEQILPFERFIEAHQWGFDYEDESESED